MVAARALEQAVVDEVISLLIPLAADMLKNHSYNPAGAAVEIFDSQVKELLASGPAGTGKTRVILEKLHWICLHYPGCRILIGRKTRVSLSETVLVTFEEQVLGEDNPILLGRGGQRIQRENRSRYRYPNGSEIVLGGMDKPRKILSSDYDIIYVPEAIELDLLDWETLITRLRHYVVPYQQIIADTNPGPPHHWLKQRCDEGTTKIIYCHHSDNPLLFERIDKWTKEATAYDDAILNPSRDEVVVLPSGEHGRWTKEGVDYLKTLNQLTGVRKDYFLKGLWALATGMVYEFNPDVHVINYFTPPSHWRRFRTVDFGLRNPFVCLWWALDEDERMYLYREIYMTGRIVEDHARQIVQLSEGERIEVTVADHDPEDAATLKRYGVPTIPAKKDIKTGIEAVEKRLRLQEDNRPRLMLMKGALVESDETLSAAKLPLCSEQEFSSYVWPKDANDKAKKEVPVDANNHGMDAIRYAVMYLENKPGAGARQVTAKFAGRRRRR